MPDDEWLQALAFLNRFQLLRVQFTNRHIHALINTHFCERPYAPGVLNIWCHFECGVFAEIALYNGRFDYDMWTHIRMCTPYEKEKLFVCPYLNDNVLRKKIFCQRKVPMGRGQMFRAEMMKTIRAYEHSSLQITEWPFDVHSLMLLNADDDDDLYIDADDNANAGDDARKQDADDGTTTTDVYALKAQIRIDYPPSRVAISLSEKHGKLAKKHGKNSRLVAHEHAFSAAHLLVDLEYLWELLPHGTIRLDKWLHLLIGLANRCRTLEMDIRKYWSSRNKRKRRKNQEIKTRLLLPLLHNARNVCIGRSTGYTGNNSFTVDELVAVLKAMCRRPLIVEGVPVERAIEIKFVCSYVTMGHFALFVTGYIGCRQRKCQEKSSTLDSRSLPYNADACPKFVSGLIGQLAMCFLTTKSPAEAYSYNCCLKFAYQSIPYPNNQVFEVDDKCRLQCYLLAGVFTFRHFLDFGAIYIPDWLNSECRWRVGTIETRCFLDNNNNKNKKNSMVMIHLYNRLSKEHWQLGIRPVRHIKLPIHVFTIEHCLLRIVRYGNDKNDFYERLESHECDWWTNCHQLAHALGTQRFYVWGETFAEMAEMMMMVDQQHGDCNYRYYYCGSRMRKQWTEYIMLLWLWTWRHWAQED